MLKFTAGCLIGFVKWAVLFALAIALFTSGTAGNLLAQAGELLNGLGIGHGQMQLVTGKLAPSPYQQEIADSAKRHGLDPLKWDAQVEQESNYDPQAVSHAGAMGLAQIMPGTWSWRNCKGDPFNPVDSLNCGASLMEWLLVKYSGNWEVALAAYNAGWGRVDQCGQCIPAGEATLYVKNIKAGHLSRLTAGEQTGEVGSIYVGEYRVTNRNLHGDPNYPEYLGVDTTGGCGAVLVAPFDGVVTTVGLETGWRGTYADEDDPHNTYIEITSLDNVWELFVYHGEYVVKERSLVQRGDVIGNEASRGNSTGCHSHIVLRKNGVVVNYLDHLQ